MRVKVALFFMSSCRFCKGESERGGSTPVSSLQLLRRSAAVRSTLVASLVGEEGEEDARREGDGGGD